MKTTCLFNWIVILIISESFKRNVTKDLKYIIHIDKDTKWELERIHHNSRQRFKLQPYVPHFLPLSKWGVDPRYDPNFFQKCQSLDNLFLTEILNSFGALSLSTVQSLKAWIFIYPLSFLKNVSEFTYFSWLSSTLKNSVYSF